MTNYEYNGHQLLLLSEEQVIDHLHEVKHVHYYNPNAQQLQLLQVYFLHLLR